LNNEDYKGIEKFNEKRDDYIVKKQKFLLERFSGNSKECNYQNI
jgi:hypothetical protein